MPTEVTVLFEFDRETKRTVRFKELRAHGRERDVMGYIYLDKATHEELGHVPKLEVRVKVVT